MKEKGESGANTITPATMHMRVIAHTGDAVYLRIPEELQRPIEGGCNCEQCRVKPELAQWDTLVVGTHPKVGFSHTVHMPDGSIATFLAYVAEIRRRKGVARG